MRARRLLAAATILVLLSACRGGAPAGGRGEGTRRMAALLERTLSEMNPDDYQYMNARRAEALRARLEEAVDPQSYFDLQPRYALELLNAGRTEEALQAYQDLEQFARRTRTRMDPAKKAFLRSHVAVVYLRLAEQENCLEHHSAESCIVPIRGGGVHARPRGAEAAIRVLTDQLAAEPDDLAARWWLNLAYMALGEYPDEVPKRWLIPPEAFASEYDIGRFHDRAADLGVDVDDLAGGSMADDFDGDGYLDIVVSSAAVHGQLRYFRNNADGTFGDRTVEAGLRGEVGGLNTQHADYDNDGFPDVLVLRGGWLGKGGRLPNSLLRNNGDGTFEDVTERAGLLSFHPTQTAAWFDYDGDGWLDLFVGNESAADDPNPSELYHSNRDGTFTECAASSGLTVDCFLKAVTSADYDNDGRPDLYVSCRGAPNRLYRNEGPRPGGRGPTEWRFTDVAARAGVTEPIYSFPAWFFDYDNDGWQDLFVLGYRAANVGDFAADYLGLPHEAERPRLYHNERDGTFKDTTRQAHLDRLLHTMGCSYGDLDNDGWLDFFLGTGDPNLGTLVPNRAFRNAAGRSFQDVTTSGGFGNLQKGHGVSFADFDEDGDQDIYAEIGGMYEGDHYHNALYENPGHGNRWLKLKLVGVRSNRGAVGARIRVLVDGEEGRREIHRLVSTGASFGGNPLRQEIGLGRARAILEVRVTWPASGIVQTFRDVAPDRSYLITEGEPALKDVTLRPFAFAARRGAATPPR